jgi:type VI protein secretion system component VasF
MQWKGLPDRRPHPLARMIRWLQLAAMVLALALCVAGVNHKKSQESFTLSPMAGSVGL